MVRPVWAEVDLQAIRSNLSAIKSRLAAPIAVMAVVKANAYGHGLTSVAKAAVEAGADRLGVALAEEAAELREAGLRVPIQILSEPPASAAERIVAEETIPAVYSFELAQALARVAASRGKKVKVHIKVDTGMHRVGVSPENAAELYRAISRLPGISVEGIFTHFACADNPDDPYTEKQLKTFVGLKKSLPGIPLWHAANSAAALFYPESRLDMVRIGIAMYGLQPALKPSPVELVPALSLKTRISFLQVLAAGEGVSYGLTYKADRPVTVATLPIGYGDGYSRLLSNKGEVLIGGRRVKLIGNICMDQSLVELDNAAARAGDQVVLLGAQGGSRITAEELASLIGTINYEIVCMINNRVPRVYLNI